MLVKLLILADIPLVAMFLAWALNMMGVSTVLFHSGFSNFGCKELQAAFGNKGPGIDTNEVGDVGKNFHVNCYSVLFSSSGNYQEAESRGIPRKMLVSCNKIVLLCMASQQTSVLRTGDICD